ncbi:MAG TPA: LytR C-terminal domain-containing protein, partial [Candidatus Krumholzibacterium sp.]|nr:LytR C-terminal domain-containing protein [Candidatus Krumholzibacterium sp.]
KKKAKKRRFTFRGGFVTLVFIVMALSLSVRWSGLGSGMRGSEDDFQMEVLNGTGEPGIALKTTMKLRMMGIDVKIEGNADRFDFRESLLIDRRGNPRLMKRLARRIGCARVIRQVQDRPEVDVTLIIGWDRERLKLD